MKYIVSLEGVEIDRKEKKLLQNPSVGGVILYLRNILFREPKDLANFIGEIRKTSGRPIKMYVDEEGGLVSRLCRFTENWSPSYIGYLYSQDPGKNEKPIRDYLSKKAKFLKDVGIDVNLAPVVDYHPDHSTDLSGRALGYGNKEIIVNLGKIWIEEHSKMGVESCLKHFPGIGRTETDPHKDLPKIGVSKEDWEANESYIFKNLLKTGVGNILVSHAEYPAIRNGEVSSLSSFWIEKIRELSGDRDLKIISDDMCMDAVSNKEVSDRMFEELGYDSIIVTEPELYVQLSGVSHEE